MMWKKEKEAQLTCSPHALHALVLILYVLVLSSDSLYVYVHRLAGKALCVCVQALSVCEVVLAEAFFLQLEAFCCQPCM